MALSNTEEHIEWRVIGQSVRGASHLRTGAPNQDALLYSPEGAASPPLIVAVSDGHGSDKCFRSDQGAQAAVQIAQHVLHEFVTGLADADLATIARLAEEQLPRELVQTWRKDVLAGLSENPISENEWAELENKVGAAARQRVESNALQAYGATLLCALVTEQYVLYIQLGDGDIICMDPDAEITRPFPQDPRLMANETTSLCTDDAWTEVRTRLIPNHDRLPVLILMSTDGLVNSYSSPEGFLKVGVDILQEIRSKGLDCTLAELEGFLAATSRDGSGDDITLALIKRTENLDFDALLTKRLERKADRQDLEDLRAADAATRAEWQVDLVIKYEQRFVQMEQRLCTLQCLHSDSRTRNDLRFKRIHVALLGAWVIATAAAAASVWNFVLSSPQQTSASTAAAPLTVGNTPSRSNGMQLKDGELSVTALAPWPGELRRPPAWRPRAHSPRGGGAREPSH